MIGAKLRRKALAAVNYDLFRLEDRCPPAPATLYTKIRRHVQGPDLAVQSTSLDFRGPSLPSVDELYRLFDLYNWTYFRGKLPSVSLEYSNRMTSAGSYSPDRRLIRIGRKYHEVFPDELGDTLKHEMIHIRHVKHNAGFKAEARRVGASVRARPHPALRRPPRYTYICPSCSARYPRQRRLRMASCGYCSKGRQFDPRYKLRLLKNAQHEQRR